MSENPVQSPDATAEPNDPSRPRNRLTAALTFGIVLQLALLVLTSMMLDDGTVLDYFCLATAGYWSGIAVVILGRRKEPTRSDLLFIRFGLLGLLIIMPLIGRMVYSIIGYSNRGGLDRLWRMMNGRV